MTGKPGVVLGAQPGPEVVNFVTAVAEAHLAYSPLVVIAGAIPRADQAKDTFQEVDQVALFAPICKHSLVVTDPSRLANSGRRGVVVVHVPRDLFAPNLPDIIPQPLTIAGPGPAAADDINAIANLLADAQRPVIFAGGGFQWGQGARRSPPLPHSWKSPSWPQLVMRM